MNVIDACWCLLSMYCAVFSFNMIPVCQFILQTVIKSYCLVGTKELLFYSMILLGF